MSCARAMGFDQPPGRALDATDKAHDDAVDERARLDAVTDRFAETGPCWADVRGEGSR
jgi:hypothetical protein